MPESFDVLIVGGGISGISLAARLAEKRRVVLVEAEEQPGHHATGRSAALLVEAYGPPEIRALAGMSKSFFTDTPAAFSEAPLAGPRGVLIYGGEGEEARLREQFDLAANTAVVRWLDAQEVLERCPLLRTGVAAAGFLETNALDLDTNGLLQGFLRMARQAGAQILTGARVEGIEHRADGWHVRAGARDLSAPVLVNAAGAWADTIAGMAGVPARGLMPLRRTAATVGVPPEMQQQLARHPFVAPVNDSYYFKPDARAIMVSLSEETPSEPCDAYPEDIDVATALDRFHTATVVPESRPVATWAGLRTFAPDRRPVVGFDATEPDFFWYAGQGGYGIKTSPALSALGAKLILDEPLDSRETAIAAGIESNRAGLSPS